MIYSKKEAKSTLNKSSHFLSSSSFLLLIFVTNKPANPLTCAELRQPLCYRNRRYSPRYQLVHHSCLFDPLADSSSYLKCIFRILENVEVMLPTVMLGRCVILLLLVVMSLLISFSQKCLRSQTHALGSRKGFAWSSCAVYLCLACSWLHLSGWPILRSSR